LARFEEMGLRALVWGAMAAAALSAAACGGDASEEGRPSFRPEYTPPDLPPPSNKEPTEPAPQTVTDAGPQACQLGPVVSYGVGRRCGLDSFGEALCNGKQEATGLVYACEDEGGQPMRPDIAGCRPWIRYTQDVPITMTLCPQSRCTRFADARCGNPANSNREGWACPGELPLVPDPAGLPSGCESIVGGWTVGRSAGPFFCCPKP
jgi:hypothetical protein